MKKLLVCALGALLWVSSAQAADILGGKINRIFSAGEFGSLTWQELYVIDTGDLESCNWWNTGQYAYFGSSTTLSEDDIEFINELLVESFFNNVTVNVSVNDDCQITGLNIGID